MHFFDKVVQARPSIVVEHPRLGLIGLPGAGSKAETLRSASLRRVLMPDVTTVCARFVQTQPGLLNDCLDVVRLPAETMWLEWPDEQLVGPLTESGSKGRAGILVQSDPDGRTGTIDTFWEDEHGEPVLCAASLTFDLDGARRGQPSKWTRRIVGLTAPELNSLIDHFELRIDPVWLSYFEAATGGGRKLEDALAQVAASIWINAPFLIAFCLLLSSKSELRFVSSDLERLNRARAKLGRPALLDHQTVSMRIIPKSRTEQPSQVFSHRLSSRLHMVHGHFVRRGASVFWRRPHLRGDGGRGVVEPRTVRLSL